MSPRSVLTRGSATSSPGGALSRGTLRRLRIHGKCGYRGTLPRDRVGSRGFRGSAMISAHRTAPRLLVLTLTTVILTACATLRVGSDHDPAVSFSAYRTYVWMPPRTKIDESPNPLVVQRAHDAIEGALAA